VLAPKAKQRQQQCARHCEFIFYSFSHLLFHYASQQDATPDCDVAVMGTKRDARPSTLSGCMEKGKRITDGKGNSRTSQYFPLLCPIIARVRNIGKRKLFLRAHLDIENLFSISFQQKSARCANKGPLS